MASSARFFNRYDIVKYAKWEPPPDEAESAIAQVREFVVKTRPEEPPSPATATAAVGGGASGAGGGPSTGAGARPLPAGGAA